MSELNDAQESAALAAGEAVALGTAETETDLAVEAGPFIEAVAMENDPDAYFAGDRGTLDVEIRRVLVRLLQRRVLFADKNKQEWKVLTENQQVIESRLHDLFVRLVVDLDRGVAFKQQVRSEEIDVPVLLRDDSYTRVETLVLVYLRTVYQRESTAGEEAVRIDIEDIEQTVLSYFAEAESNTAARQRSIRSAVGKLRQEGIIDEESEGRFLITPLIEILLSADRLRELHAWLREQRVVDAGDAANDAPSGAAPQEAPEENSERGITTA